MIALETSSSWTRRTAGFFVMAAHAVRASRGQRFQHGVGNADFVARMRFIARNPLSVPRTHDTIRTDSTSSRRSRRLEEWQRWQHGSAALEACDRCAWPSSAVAADSRGAASCGRAGVGASPCPRRPAGRLRHRGRQGRRGRVREHRPERRRRRRSVFSNWIGYVDPVKSQDTSTLEKFEQETGITVDYKNGDVNDNETFFAKVSPAAAGLQVHRPRRLRGDRLDGRPDDRPGLDPEARPRQDAQRRRQPDRLPQVARLGPQPRLQRPVAERHDRHLLQLRAHRPGDQLRGAAHPPRPQGQDRAAHRDARHDAVHAADAGQRPERLHRRRVRRRRSRRSRGTSTTARSAASPATTTSTT